MQIIQSRRDFLASASMAGAASVFGSRRSLADEPPPETTTIRLGRFVGICAAPVYTAEALLRAEGFTDVRWVPKPPLDAVARGAADFDIEAAPWVVAQLAAGEPATALAGIHPGCFELFAYEPIRTISDLRGKRFGIPAFGSSPHLQLAVMAAHVGLDPKKSMGREPPHPELFVDGKSMPSRFPPSPGDARPQIGRDPQQPPTALVGVLLLH